LGNLGMLRRMFLLCLFIFFLLGLFE
jgi:hypothetical protein